MKRLMLFLGATAFLLLVWADAVGAIEKGLSSVALAKEGWEVYRLTRPQGIAKIAANAPALGKMLAPFGVPKGPPIEYDRTATMDSVTMVIGRTSPGWEHFDYIPRIRAKDIALLKANPEEGQKGYNVIMLEYGIIIEPGAVIVYDLDHPVMFKLYASRQEQNITATIGAPGGELVNFIGSGRTEKLFPEEIGSLGLTGAGPIVMNNVVIHNHQYGMSMNLTNFRNTSITGSGVYVMNNTVGFYPPGDPNNVMREDHGLNGWEEFDAQLNLTDSWFSGNWYADVGPIMKYSRFGGTIAQSALMSPRPVWVENIGEQLIDRKLELRDCAFEYGSGVIPYLNERVSFASKMVSLTQTDQSNGLVTQVWPELAPIVAFDYNRNGIVEIADIKDLAGNFNKPVGDSVPWYYDSNENGTVDLSDLLSAGFAYLGLPKTATLAELTQDAKAESLVMALSEYPDVVNAVKANKDIWAVLEPLFSPTAVLDTEAGKPTRFVLHQNYPNPFNANTTIRFELEKDGIVRLAVYNMAGQIVRMLTDARLNSGVYTEMWDGKDNFGVDAGSGVYLYRLTAGSDTLVRTLTLVR